MDLAGFRPKTLPGGGSASEAPAPTVAPLRALALDAVAAHFASKPSLAGIPPALLASLSMRLPATLEPRLTMPLVADERYWQRACEEGRGWLAVDIQQHGGSWRQAFAELFVSSSLRQFGVYPEQPPGWDLDFLRPPIDSRHRLWGACHPRGPLERPDRWPASKGKEDVRFMPWRERFSRGAIEHPDLDERIASASDCGWPYLERLKAALRLKTKAAFGGAPGMGYDLAWADVDRAAHLARAAEEEKAEAAGAAQHAAPPPAALPGAPPLPLPDLSRLTVPAATRAAEQAARATLALLRRDDAVDCTLGNPALGAGSCPLREWLSPAQEAAWAQPPMQPPVHAWPGERGLSVLVKRARELQALMENITACKDYCMALDLHCARGRCGLPSHLDLELPLSHLPQLQRLKLTYGALDRHLAPLPGLAPPLPEELLPAMPDEDEPPAITPPLTASPDTLVLGMQPSDLASLARCLRHTESLLVLDLQGNSLSDAMAPALCAALARNATLTTLNLSHNCLGGGAWAALARLLTPGSSACPPITRLSLANNAGDASGAAALAAALGARSTLQHLDCSMNTLGDAGCAALLRAAGGHPSLEHLGLAYCGAGSASGAEVLQLLGGGSSSSSSCCSSKGLVHLDVSGNVWGEPVGEGSSGEAPKGGTAAAAGAAAGAALVEQLGAALAARGAGSRLQHLDVRPCAESPALSAALRDNRLRAKALLQPARGIAGLRA